MAMIEGLAKERHAWWTKASIALYCTSTLSVKGRIEIQEKYLGVYLADEVN